MNQEKEIPKTYYEKILVSSGEVPENTNHVITDKGKLYYSPIIGVWCNQWGFPLLISKPEWYFKPIPSSPKQEAVEFAEWADKNYMNTPTGWIPRGGQYDKDYKCYTLSELYDKFKEKGE